MKVAIILLDYIRHDFTEKVKSVNLHNAGHEFNLIIVDRHGIAAALNEGIEKSKWADAIVTMANDIVMPNNWLKNMVDSVERLSHLKIGMVGIHTVESIQPLDENGVHPTWCPFGNALITRKALNKVGYFNTDHDPYGMQDSDFGYRLDKLGFYSYYLPNLKAEHIGSDVGSNTEYRKMKDESLAIAAQKYGNWCAKYNLTGNYYLPLNQN